MSTRHMWSVQLCVLLLAALLHSSLSAQSFLSPTDRPGAIPLSIPERSTTLCGSSRDFPGVVRVLQLLQKDIARVTGRTPALQIDSIPGSTTIVLVGTIGKNPLIDRLIAEQRLDVREIAGKWETYLIQGIERPFPGVEHLVVIAGSDKRGTIYGMLDLSAQSGVSPWTWWADVPPQHHPRLYLLPGRHTAGEPKVRYRGIFINDEEPALGGWAREKFGGFNSRFYEQLFELLLRMKGNLLWPAMWGSAFADDDSLSPRLADEYGIVVGTSHHEPMMRAHAEWGRYGSGPWNYDSNEPALKEFWRRGIERMGSHESIVTLGMRGDGDEPMAAEANISLLERIVKDQREIIAGVTGKKASVTPQVWALYKEVQEYYDRGMTVPDDVTLLFCDDNWGNVRRLPDPGAKPRAGGYGMYYHFDFVGGPRNYKWLNTTQIARVWEQMHLAYEYGVRQLWIVNVGDIKPLELPTQFFLDYAWDPTRLSAERLPEYTRQWARQQFGDAHAPEIARILTATTTLNARRKPEMLSPDTYSLVNFHEAERVVKEFHALAAAAERVGNLLPSPQKDAYMQLVLHPVLASANLNELLVTVGRNRLYARQGRAVTNELAVRAGTLFEKDSLLSYQFNRLLAGGKWNHMMDQTHIGYTGWQQPDRNVMPPVDTILLPEEAALGVAIEGSDRFWPGEKGVATLPAFDPYGRQTRTIEVFSRGAAPMHYSAVPAAPWVRVNPREGNLRTGEQLSVSVDWNRAPEGVHRVPITITGATAGANAPPIVVTAVVRNPRSPKPDELIGFIEQNGLVSIEAEHFTGSTALPPYSWQRIPDLGRTLSAMTPMPVTAPPVTPGGSSPHLEYRVRLFTAGEITLQALLSPTLSFRPGSPRTAGLRYAVSFDDQPPQIVNIHQADTVQDWKYPLWWSNAVGENIRRSVTRHTVRSPGDHIVKFWMVDPGVVLQKLVVATDGIPPSYLGPPESTRRFPLPRQAKGEYSNPILPGFYPDPSICAVEGTYYLVTSTFAYFPGIPLFRSTDLLHWELIGHVLDRPEQLNLERQGVSRGLFAPSIRYHEGRFYVTCTLVDIGGNFVVTATDPAGPWSDPVWIREVDGIDPSLFFDDDGKGYLLYNSVPPENKPLYDGHRTIRMRAFDPVTLNVTGPEKILINGGVDISQKPVWIEAPHIFKINGSYLLIAAEGGTAEGHSEVALRSANVEGPYVPYSHNPILTQRDLDPGRDDPITSTGHADFVQTPNGDWWAVFLGCRPYPSPEPNQYNTGRETFLVPVRWDGPWPVINEKGRRLPYRMPRPDLPPTESGKMYDGRFTERDEFDEASLDRAWMFLRTPHEKWFDLTTHPGSLTIKLRPESCSGSMNPSFLGRRQQHLWGSASAAIRFHPESENEKAGLLIFQNESRYYFLALSRMKGETAVQLFRSAPGKGEEMELLASQAIAQQHVAGVLESEGCRLKIEARGSMYAFSFAPPGGSWTSLAEGVDARYLSTKGAGGFVGCVFALYATSLGLPTERSAVVDWFEYTGDDESHRTRNTK